MSDMVKVSICDGKYTIIQDASGRTSVLRHGEEWRDSTGDNVILGAAYEIQKLQDRIKRLEEAGDAVQRDKQALKKILSDMGVVGSMGFGSTVKWTKAKEAKL